MKAIQHKPNLKRAAVLLFGIMMTCATVKAQDTPCLPLHGETDNQSAWCGGTTQEIQLSAGWNWVSFYVEITLNDLKAAILAAVPASDRPIIKSKSNGQTNWLGTMWTPQLKALDLSQMYMIKVNTACTITLQGEPIDPADHPVTIKKKSANWIAFPLSESMTVTNAFSTINPAISDIVKSKSAGQATRLPSGWSGNLKDLTPGQGYIYTSKANVDKTLTFPTSNAK